MIDILFIVKDKNINTVQKQIAGLLHAAQGNCEYLKSIGVNAEVVSVPDANYLDTVLKQYNPKIVVIEAVWVNPEKFKTLISANPGVQKFIIRVHSDFAYFAIESVGFEWMFESERNNQKVHLAANCHNFASNMKYVTNKEFLYLPNIFQRPLAKTRKEKEDDVVRIGVFGAIRLLKNHLTQAIAAIRFAEEIKKTLYFHVNELVNDAGGSILSSMKVIFNENKKHKLEVEKYKNGLAYDNMIRYMDAGMQLSFTESFNLVAANFACNGVPIVVSETVNWMPKSLISSCTDIDDIVNKLRFAYTHRNNPTVQMEQYRSLMDYNNGARDVWNNFIKNNIV